MKKRCFIIIIVIGLTRSGIGLYAQYCPQFNSYFGGGASLPNPCVNHNMYCEEYWFIPGSGTMNYTTSVNFGDGSPILNIPYTGSGYFGSRTPEIIHTYLSGTYIPTISINGPGTCVDTRTTTIISSGDCEACPIYSILSTGYNRTIGQPYPMPHDGWGFLYNNGYDSCWYVIKRQDLDGSYNPVGAPTYFLQNQLAFNVAPYLGPLASPPIGTARFISLNPSAPSTYPSNNIVTYRTYFTLPNPFPTGVNYLINMGLRADDGVYQVSLNGTDIKSPGFSTCCGGAAYLSGGDPMYLSVNSNTSSAFLPGSNYIDITIGDLFQVAFFMEAEILLYQCSVPLPCTNCISSFAPIPGKKYLLSAWVKEDNAPQSKTSYTCPSIEVLYPSVSSSSGSFMPAGNIIDGWQRIEGEFIIPSNTTDINLKLNCSGSNDCYYDDVRVFPYDGSLKSYVYDPVNKRLVAELDERNYSTLYEYDEEGKLIRVKKETEKGIMTIKENRDNTIRR